VPELLRSIVEWWSSLYDGSQVLIAVTRFSHLAGLVLGGGAAIALDRASIRAGREGTEFRVHHLAQLARGHRVVIAGLALIVFSGLLMLASELETFLASWVFRTKMLLVLLLVVNGYGIVRVERRLRPQAPAGWLALGVRSRLSTVLWLVIVLAGTVLVLLA
jgi:hypothetical protein